jgi:hypothetical protein
MLKDASPASGAPASQPNGPSAPAAPQEAGNSEGQSASQREGGQAQPQPSGATPGGTGAGGSAAGAQERNAETGSRSSERPPVDWQSVDPREALSNIPGLQRIIDSRVGDLSARQAQEMGRQIADQIIADHKLTNQLEQRRQLRATDPEAFAKWDEEQEREWMTARDVDTRSTTQAMTRLNQLIGALQHELADEVQEEVAGKTFKHPSGDPLASRQMYLKALLDAAVKHGVKSELGPALAKAKEQLEESHRLAANGKANGSEPNARVEAGAASSDTEFVGQDEFNANRANPTWRTENKERLSRSYGKTILY